MPEIDHSSENASRVSRVVAEATFRENLLALHAAIEAACAGSNSEELRNRSRRGVRAASAIGTPAAQPAPDQSLPSPQRRFLLDTEDPTSER